jgi:integrase
VETLEEAKALQARFRAELMNGGGGGEGPAPSVPVQAPWTLQEVARRVTNASPPEGWKGSRGEETAALNTQAAINFYGGDMPLAKIDREALDDYALHLEAKGNSNATINRKMASLSKLFVFAIARGRLATKPRMPRRKEPLGRIRFLSDAEEATLLALLEQWGKDDVRDAVIVLIDTGIRCGELLRLEAKDVDRKGRLITLWQTKADLPRSIPMTGRVYEIIKRRSLAACFQANVKSPGRLFPIEKHAIRRAWDRARAHMGLADDPHFVPHVCRHTCASRLVQRGVHMRVVQQWLGHKSITMTERYAVLAPANLQAAVAVLEQPSATVTRLDVHNQSGAS